jgi:phosphoribosylamine--glycine ligase|tara:strand:+ start:637 stop:1911 length:1275 start_codon:yes stop_codon:yes gene_type:complete
MKILVVGSGAREHALCWAISASPLCDTLYCAPGNAGIEEDAICVPLNIDDIQEITQFSVDKSIDLVVVGPEGPLVNGLVDDLSSAGIKAFGPSAAAAQLEGSKSFTKEFCKRHNIPTAAYARFTSYDEAISYIRHQGAPIVIKADGLAAGKGVTVAHTEAEAEKAVIAALRDKAFGEAGNEVVIEEFLLGEEASFHVLVDGKTAVPLATAQDHKAVGEGDIGPNTGGMGTYSPAPVIDQNLTEIIMEQFIQPTIKGMAEEGNPYKGVLYAGLMITPSGPKLIEYNARFGDPETQVLILRLKSDLLPALIACVDGQLSSFDLRWDSASAVCVVMATKGYPGNYTKGSVIRGIDTLKDNDNMKIFHAGTTRSSEGQIIADGGRVLGVTALGADISLAQRNAYLAVDKVHWPEGFFRRDIGWRAIKK